MEKYYTIAESLEKLNGSSDNFYIKKDLIHMARCGELALYLIPDIPLCDAYIAKDEKLARKIEAILSSNSISLTDPITMDFQDIWSGAYKDYHLLPLKFPRAHTPEENHYNTIFFDSLENGLEDDFSCIPFSINFFQIDFRRKAGSNAKRSFVYFSAIDIENLISKELKKTQTDQNPDYKEANAMYIEALRILAETIAGPLPDHKIPKAYLNRLLANESSNQFKNSVNRNTQTWENHLFKYHEDGVSKVSDALSANLKYLAVAVGGPFPERIKGTPSPDLAWAQNFINRLPKNHRSTLSVHSWLSILKT